MKKLSVILAFVMVSSMSFSGCKKAADSTKPEVTTIQFMETLTSPARTKFVKELVADFESKNKDVKVELISEPWEQAHDKIITMSAANQLPDVIEMGANWVSEVGATGKLEDLGPYLDKWDQKDTLTETSLKLGKAYKDTLYVIPHSLYFQAMYYRNDWLKTAGIDVPITTDDFFNTAIKMTDASKNKYGYSFRGGAGSWTLMSNFIMTNGGFSNYFDESGKCVFRKPEAVETFVKFTDMYKKAAPKDALNWGYAETVAAFTAGSTALIIQDSEVIVSCEEKMAEGTFETGLCPVGPDGKRYLQGGYIGFSMTSASEKKDASWKFISYMMSPEVNLKWGVNNSVIPATKVPADNSDFKKGKIAAYTNTIEDPNTVLFSAPEYLPEWGEFTGKIAGQELQGYLLEKQTPQETMDNISTYLETANNKYNKK
ncbi:sugar ABC transporter substrate-binding protein [Clostridium sp.]|uniref:ABC transporter substrate-binding protein n=1 Tax=Clostridium sp. TaxID=1506 RepID=UPI001A42A973|nr:sugar ABC transporter substrate-binding protein [Clostridium sp.]MBK5236891.1 sugar ABC transporter substrate-binding protein [Clostridium sp.]